MEVEYVQWSRVEHTRREEEEEEEEEKRGDY